jgi:hypothetical protein
MTGAQRGIAWLAPLGRSVPIQGQPAESVRTGFPVRCTRGGRNVRGAHSPVPSESATCATSALPSGSVPGSPAESPAFR